MKNTAHGVAEAELYRLGIRYRKLDCTGGMFYYCRLPDGITFDLFAGDDGSVKLWRFVSAALPSESFIKYEYQDPAIPGFSIGLEVTEEGDVSFYVQRQIDPESPERAELMYKTIAGYAAMLAQR